MALEILPVSDIPLLELRDEAAMRTTARAAENQLGKGHEFTQHLLTLVDEATKALAGGEYLPAAVLWDEEADLASEVLMNMYQGFPHYERRINGKVTSVEWNYGDRLGAQAILDLKKFPVRSPEVAEPVSLPVQDKEPETSEQNRSTFTWVTGILGKLSLARLMNSGE